MKRLIKMGIALLLLPIFPAPAFFPATAEAAGGGPIKIIVTTDIHGYLAYDPENRRPGLARLKAYADRLAADGYLTFLLDCGDAVSGGAYAQADRGRLAADLMGLAGYRALTPGNHEFDHNEAEKNFLYYSEELLPLMRRHSPGRPEATAVNLSYNGRDLPGVTRAPIIIYDETAENPDGLRLIAAGVAHPYTARPTLAPSIPGYDFGLKADGGATREFLLARLDSALSAYGRDNDVVIVLSHLGFPDDRNGDQVAGPDLAAAENVDFIADGHSHRAVAPRRIGAAVYGNGGRYLENFLEISIEKDQRRMELKGFSDLAPIPPDPGLEERLAQFELAHGFNEVLLNLGDDVFSDRNPNRGPSPLGRLITRSMAAASGADLAFHNSTTIRAGLPRGPVTTRLMYDVLPFANELLTYRLTGREIEALFQTYLADGPGRVQFHGVQVRAYPKPGGGLVPAEIRADSGEALEPERVYSVAVNGFLSRGRGGFSFQGRESRDHGDLTAAVIKQLKQLAPGDLNGESLLGDNLIVMESGAEAGRPEKLSSPGAGSGR